VLAAVGIPIDKQGAHQQDHQDECADRGVVGFTFHGALTAVWLLALRSMAISPDFRALLEPRIAALAVEIGLDPRIRIFDDAIQRIDFHMTLDNHPTRLQVRKMESRSCVIMTTVQPQLLLQIQYQLIELGGADRSRPEVGSSRNSRRGSRASARQGRPA